jgi:hypothetical protein
MGLKDEVLKAYKRLAPEERMTLWGPGDFFTKLYGIDDERESVCVSIINDEDQISIHKTILKGRTWKDMPYVYNNRSGKVFILDSENNILGTYKRSRAAWAAYLKIIEKF